MEWRPPANAVEYRIEEASSLGCQLVESSMMDGIGRLGDNQGRWTWVTPQGHHSSRRFGHHQQKTIEGSTQASVSSSTRIWRPTRVSLLPTTTPQHPQRGRVKGLPDLGSRIDVYWLPQVQFHIRWLMVSLGRNGCI